MVIITGSRFSTISRARITLLAFCYLPQLFTYLRPSDARSLSSSSLLLSAFSLLPRRSVSWGVRLGVEERFVCRRCIALA